MKVLTGIFGIGLAGVVVCLVMTVVTAVHEHRAAEVESAKPISIPTPALPAQGR